MSRISRPAVRGKTKKSFFSRSSVSFASLVILLLWILYVQFFAEIYHEERPFFNTLEGMKNISGSSLPSSNQRVHQCKLHGETIKLPMAPDLIVAGAQKAGTSAFYLMLRKHPNLVSSSTVSVCQRYCPVFYYCSMIFHFCHLTQSSYLSSTIDRSVVV